MKNRVTYWILGLGLMAAVSGCQQHEVSSQEPLHELVIVNATIQHTKASGTGGFMTTFDIGDQLGVFVVNKTTSVTQDDNVKATYTGGTGEELDKWELERSIMLPGSEVLVTGYFPYVSGVALNAIPLTSGTHDVNTNDLIFLQQIADGVSNYEVKLENMKHAMTRVQIKLRREPNDGGAYVGAGQVTALTIADNKPAGTLIYTAGKLDVSNITGDPTTTGTTAGPVQVAKDYLLTTTSALVFDILLLPVADLTGESVKLMLEIDGKTLELPFPSDKVAAWEAGKMTWYDLTVQNVRVAFDKVTASPWNDEGNANQGVAVGDHADGGIVFWVDPATPNHHKVVSLYEPPLGTLAQADAYGPGYGAGWRLPDAAEAPLLHTALTAVAGAITTYHGMPLVDAPYWVNNPSGDNAYNITTGVGSTVAADAKLNIRVIKEVNP